jgi:hypothetical protein
VVAVQVRMQVRWCSDCAGETLFEVPPCEDGHGEDCLDLACVDCGAAVSVGVLLVATGVAPEVRAA